MRKGRRKNKQGQPSFQTENHLHFRLCHVCLFLNESDHEVKTCKKCGSDFRPETSEAGVDEVEQALDLIWQQSSEAAAEEEEYDEPAFAALRRRGFKTVHGLKVRW